MRICFAQATVGATKVIATAASSSHAHSVAEDTDKTNTCKSAGSKDVADKSEANLETSSLLLPHVAKGMKEQLLQSTFLGGVAGSTMGALFQAGRSVPIFGEVH